MVQGRWVGCPRGAPFHPAELTPAWGRPALQAPVSGLDHPRSLRDSWVS